MRTGKFFRPAPPSGGGESSDEEGDSDEGAGTQGRKDQIEDDDDDEDSFIDDNDEEEGISGSNKRKAEKKGGGAGKRSKVSFFDEEALSDGDENDGEDEAYGTHHDPEDRVKRHYTQEDIRREQLDDDAREIMRMQDRRRQQAGFHDFEEMSAQEMARQIEMRHRMTRRTVNRNNIDDEGPGGAESQFSAVSQQSLVPSVSDPSMWMFKCIPGKEQELVIQLLNKCKAAAMRGKPTGITAAIAAQSKGLIYVESYNEPSVVEVVQGVRQLMSYSMKLVPINDMTTVMSVVPSKRPGMFVALSAFNFLLVPSVNGNSHSPPDLCQLK
jgi:transcription elongation factor SPT5